MRKFSAIAVAVFCLSSFAARAVSGEQLFDLLRKKMLTVKDYTAEVKMKINVSYMRIPTLAGTLYFKSPDKMKLERHGGLSIMLKKNINLTVSNMIPTGSVTVLDMGNVTIDGQNLRVLKIIPEDDQGQIILAKIWVDENSMLVVRTETTTRNDGTIKMALQYGKYISYALPDKVTIDVDVKDFKLPKGVTMDYNEVRDETPKKETKNRKGTIQLNYISYQINTGIDDKVFSKK
jgi:outer membrane lipoprotein-sorting protein